MTFFMRMWLLVTVTSEVLSMLLLYYGVTGDRMHPGLIALRWLFSLMIPCMVFLFLFLLSRTESKKERES